MPIDANYQSASFPEPCWFPIIFNNLQGIEKSLEMIIGTKYRHALEIIISQKIEGEFGLQKKGIQSRSRRFRETIELIEQLGSEMGAIVSKS
jgi:hypothetical protein